MDSNFISLFKKECAELLQAQSLETLRCYGRFIGMQKPTTLSKPALIEEIMATICGEIPPSRNQRGAPIKHHWNDQEFIERINLLIAKYENVTTEESALCTDSNLSNIPTEQSTDGNSPKNTNLYVNLNVNFSDLSDEQKEILRSFLKTL